MSDSSFQKQLGADSPLDMIVLWLAGLFALGWVTTHLGTLGNHLVAIAIRNHVLVAASHTPRLALPGCGGAGLDDTRLLLLAALLVMTSSTLAPRILAARHARRSRQE